MAAPTPTSERSLVLVAGSGRSGTSLLSGILQRLGFHVPRPEVPADETNPRGFGESQWVVDFHTRLLRRAAVQTSDARPAAWALTATAALEEGVGDELTAWLTEQFAGVDHVLVKDPRLSWFLPLWRRCAAQIGVTPRAVTMVRHPAAVVASKQRWYGGWQSEVGRTAGWLNQTLFTERATRDLARAFVRYDDLLEDWTRVVGALEQALDLAVLRDAPAPAMRRVHEFVDRGLSRSKADWGDLRIPAALREQADATWDEAGRLAERPGAEDADAAARLDELRAAYTALYEEAEAITQSSVAAAARTAKPAAAAPRPAAHPTALRALERVPPGLRRAVPVTVKARVVRTLRGTRRRPAGRRS